MKNKSIQFKNSVTDAQKKILSADALEFIMTLHFKFNDRRKKLLDERDARQSKIDQGEMPDFLPETKDIRSGEWKVDPVPQDIEDRRVEITGPVDRKMIINALNSGAKVFMADFEDSNAPTWGNNIEGQINLYDAVRGTIDFINAQGKEYKLKENTATLFVRPRGLHLTEKFAALDNELLSGSLFDFGLYIYHNAKVLIEKGSGPYFYIPKLESHLEARWWNDIFSFSEDYLGIKKGCIKATVLIETILAAFETEEILYELREHSAGLNCGRWDYIFSYIKKLNKYKDFILPDRSKVTMTVPFMKAYSEHTIKTCHKRGAFAMGGMAAQIPIKNDEKANEEALKKVSLDKKREALAGHDGTWVAHPGLIPIAMAEFDKYMPEKNQIDKQRHDVNVTAKDLLAVPEGSITIGGIKNNIDVSIQYMFNWLNGLGCVPIYNLMEDAATAEISRAQLWQWVNNNVKTEDGQIIDKVLFETQLDEVVQKLSDKFDIQEEKFQEAVSIIKALVLNETFESFLTLKAYENYN